MLQAVCMTLGAIPEEADMGHHHADFSGTRDRRAGWHLGAALQGLLQGLCRCHAGACRLKLVTRKFSQRPSAPSAMQAAGEEEAAPQAVLANGADSREPEGVVQEQAPPGRLQQVGWCSVSRRLQDWVNCTLCCAHMLSTGRLQLMIVIWTTAVTLLKPSACSRQELWQGWVHCALHHGCHQASCLSHLL